MAKMAKHKRRYVVSREASGRPQREERAPAAVVVRRLRDAALQGLRDPEWGGELGRLYLTGSITDQMYAAGKRWRELAATYRAIIGAQDARSASLEVGATSHPPDPASEAGERLASRERDTMERYMAAHAVLVAAGMGCETAVRLLCECDRSLAGMLELRAARTGLLRLAEHYRL